MTVVLCILSFMLSSTGLSRCLKSCKSRWNMYISHNTSWLCSVLPSLTPEPLELLFFSLFSLRSRPSYHCPFFWQNKLVNTGVCHLKSVIIFRCHATFPFWSFSIEDHFLLSDRLVIGVALVLESISTKDILIPLGSVWSKNGEI